MRHFVHRHEPPVPDSPVDTLAVTDTLVAVNKPPCMPVHVAGQYRKNTVLGVLAATRPELGELHAVHRLDKPVSGVLLLSRTAAAADSVRARIMDRSLRKVYVARVEGARQACGPISVSMPTLVMCFAAVQYHVFAAVTTPLT